MIREGEQFLILKVGFLTFESHALFFKGNRSQRTQGTFSLAKNTCNIMHSTSTFKSVVKSANCLRILAVLKERRFLAN